MARWVLSGILATGISVPGGWGEEPGGTAPTGDPTEQVIGRYHLQPAFTKLGRGAANTLFGWLEIPETIHERYTPDDVGTGFFTGLGIGILKGLVRTGIGLYETVTFFLPYPEGFAPLLPPLGYFQQGRRERLPLS